MFKVIVALSFAVVVLASGCKSEGHGRRFHRTGMQNARHPGTVHRHSYEPDVPHNRKEKDR